MNKLYSLILMLAALGFASPAMAWYTCPNNPALMVHDLADCPSDTGVTIDNEADADANAHSSIRNSGNSHNDNSNHNQNHNSAQGGDGGHGVGVGVGVGHGGSATGGNATGGSVGNSGNSNLSLNMDTRLGAAGGDANATGGSSDQTQSQTASANNEGNSFSSSSTTDARSTISTSTTVTGDTFEGDTTIFQDAPAAFAGFSNNVISGCARILGFDFRDADSAKARGASFGIPLPAGDCKLGLAAEQAFLLGNERLGWNLYCAQKAVWKGMRTIRQAETGVRLSKEGSIRACLSTAIDAVATQETIIQTEYVEVEVPADCHPHVENAEGYLEYNGKTYINRDKAYDPNWSVESVCASRDQHEH